MVFARNAQHTTVLVWCLVWASLIVIPAHAAAQGASDSGSETGFVWPVVADPNTDPVVFAVSQRLESRAFNKKFHPDDVAALQQYYKSSQQPPLWIGDHGFSDRAKAAASEVATADDWGLKRDDYRLPAVPAENASVDEKADAEIEFGLTVLKFARHARQGRVRPTSVTRINDFPGLSGEDVADMWRDLVQSKDAQSFLRGLHPKYPQFKRLRQALLKARGRDRIETGALPVPKKTSSNRRGSQVNLPKGTDLTPGMQHKDIVLLRERLGVEADIGANTHYFDAPLAKALEEFQSSVGLVPTGNLDAATRKRLNAVLTKAEDDAIETAREDRDAKRKTAGNSRKIQLILNNMERWRWLPDDLGDFYVWNNVPEFRARVFKGEDAVFSEKIIVGLPEWATPSFMADMKFVIFRPSWGVPRGIKLKELLPRLKRAQPQSIFDFFGGGGGTQAVLKAYNLNVYKNGKQINPNGINWNSSNILNYSFIQPPGGKNPLGIVKFRFPNKHNVYMHDTIEPELFGKARRAYSHGCIRVRNPVKLAEVLLAQDNGYSSAAVRSMVRSGRSVTLERDIPVYVTYMTARVDDKGVLHTYGDLYGRDGRLARQLGREMRFEQPKIAKPKKKSGSRTARKKRKKKKKATSSVHRIPSSIGDAVSGRYN